MHKKEMITWQTMKTLFEKRKRRRCHNDTIQNFICRRNLPGIVSKFYPPSGRYKMLAA